MFYTHAWFTRYWFPRGGDSVVGHYTFHIEPAATTTDLTNKFLDLLKGFSDEIGGQYHAPVVLGKDRFLLEGPKGISILEVAPAFTQEEFDKVNVAGMDLSVFEKMFSDQNLPQEPNEKVKS